MNNHLHIVCFDVPYPVSHGGYFDLFYKLKALKETGVSVHLHCFEYGRGKQPELENYCASVRYYRRKKILGISPTLPYIVSSRTSSALIKNLSADTYPILLEGTHCTYILYKDLFPGRKILYRLHNIEHIYYHHLFQAENNLLKKAYFYFESRLLKKYERAVASLASQVLAVSEKDAIAYKQLYPGARASYFPLFHPFHKSKCRPGKGNFILYHGNLSVPENEKAALFLADALKEIQTEFVIAGRNPSAFLVSGVKKFGHVTVKSNPTEEEMESLVRSAHINIVYSLNATGIKIKLLHALYSGRHCIANEAAVPGEEFREFCTVLRRETDVSNAVQSLLQKDFTVPDAQKRAVFLEHHYNNARNAAALSAFLQ